MMSAPESVAAPAQVRTVAHDRATPPRSWSVPERLWVVALVLAVVIPGAWHLSRPSFWNDEAATWAISGHSFDDLLHILRTSGGDRGAALYYAIAFVWMRTFGTSELALRSLSLLAAAATMVPFHACARRLVATPAAWAAGAVLATSSFLLEYARDARTYALALLLVVLAVWTFLRAVESVSARDWWIFTFFAAVAIYAHWFSALVILALFVALFGWHPGARLRHRALTSAVGLAVIVLPIVAVVLDSGNSGVDWIAPLDVAELRALIAQFTGTTSPALQTLVAIPLAVGLAASWNAGRRRRAPRIVLMWFVLPVGLTIVISVVKPLLVARYLIVALPAFALLLGLGLSRLARGRVVPLAVMTLALVVLCYGNFWGSSNGGEDWRAIVATVGQQADREDAIVVFPATAVSAFSYYARDDPSLRQRPGPSWPRTRWDTPFMRSIPNTAVLRADGIARSRVVWLIVRVPRGGTVAAGVRHSPVLAALRQQLEARFARAAIVPPWRASDTVFVVRYSQPTQP
jgi:mannosyltransferase